MADTFTPPADVAANARQALEVRQSKPESQRGMTAVGLARANQLANRDPVSLETVRRMVAYFERHEVDKQGATWDDQGPGWQAWQGWGGDEGRAWARRIMEDNMETKASRRHSESDMEALRTAAHHTKQTMKALRTVGYDGLRPKSVKALDESATLNERQVALYDMYESIVEEYGVFDRGIGANGAHYAEAAQNPFKDEGMVCKNCVFFLANRCEIIDGDIEDEAICKFWIIPESLLGIESEPMDEAPAEPMAEAEPMNEEMMTADKAIEDRESTPAERADMPAGDFVIPETRNFPVVTPGDIPAAVSSWGRYRGDVTFEEFKQRLIAIAQRKGEEFVARLPQEWKDEMAAEKSAALDSTPTMETAEAVKRFARRLMGRE